jgi:putative RecB family exonuclease
MEEVYSYSKLKAFEQCKLQYKFRYIDKIIPEIEKSIEAHLGNSVHTALEWFYNQVQKGKVPHLDELIVYYIKTWKENYKPELVVVRENMTDKDYFEQGVLFLINYYANNKPFDDNTIEVEKKIIITLDHKYKIQGFIDRLVHNLDTGEFEIHDYKIYGMHPKKDHAEKDNQLALYAIAIKEIFGKDKEVVLVWHYLAHNRKLKSKRTNDQLEILKKETLEKIKEIESEIDFSPNKGPLCQWCRYRNICPAWGGDPSKAKRWTDIYNKKE